MQGYNHSPLTKALILYYLKEAGVSEKEAQNLFLSKEGQKKLRYVIRRSLRVEDLKDIEVTKIKSLFDMYSNRIKILNRSLDLNLENFKENFLLELEKGVLDKETSTVELEFYIIEELNSREIEQLEVNMKLYFSENFLIKQIRKGSTKVEFELPEKAAKKLMLLWASGYLSDLLGVEIADLRLIQFINKIGMSSNSQSKLNRKIFGELLNSLNTEDIMKKIKSDLLTRCSEDLESCLEVLVEISHDKSQNWFDTYNIIGRFNDITKKYNRGEINIQDYDVLMNKVRLSTIELISKLSFQDIQVDYFANRQKESE